jgi:hypothetical protein
MRTISENTQPVKLKWLGTKPELDAGVTWGVPWKRGELDREERLYLVNDEGRGQEIQSWPTAYWPDGSVKWTAHAASLQDSLTSTYSLIKSDNTETKPNEQQPELVWLETREQIVIDTGMIKAVIPKQGRALIETVERQGKQILAAGKLVCIREERQQLSGGRVTTEEKYESVLDHVSVERSGPVRLVVLAEGRHRAVEGNRSWLPFRVRMVFYRNQDSIRFTHSFLYDGDAAKDYINGIGISFQVPLSGALYNRHVRLAGDTGYFSESPKNLAINRTKGKYVELYRQQQEGVAVHLDEQTDAEFLSQLEESAVWDSFRLIQESPDSYSVSKCTGSECSWLKAVSGHRARGLAYLGSQGGGIAVGVRNFWRKYPQSFEVQSAASDLSELRVWFWSPEGASMDLRHYDTRTHVDSSYEGAYELRSTPYGIGNTNEFILWCCGETPKADRLDKMIQYIESPPLLVCEPERFYETKALGTWSLPDRSTEVKARIEHQLDELLGFYQKEVEQRRWYGFWDYGDFMHTYDSVRHTWRYDMGGFAWQNTELVPNMWLWTMFLRSGREDIFRIAEAMTRHTSEVDVYHLGEYKGLGSRHNVMHWGCGCKEARISMAGLHKYYYYLTADERIGDILDEVADADFATLNLDPMQYYFPKDQYPTHIRSGPDWAAFVSNWMYQWERYEKTGYRDKIMQGIADLKQAPFRLLSGTTFGYEPETGKLHYLGDDNYDYHMAVSFGAPQVWLELAGILSDPEWTEMLVEFGAFYHMDKEKIVELTSGRISGNKFHWPMFATTLSGFAAAVKQDSELASRTWNLLLDPLSEKTVRIPVESKGVSPHEYAHPVQEVPWITTNLVSQWSLNTVLCLEFIGEWLPDKL